MPDVFTAMMIGAGAVVGIIYLARRIGSKRKAVDEFKLRVKAWRAAVVADMDSFDLDLFYEIEPYIGDWVFGEIIHELTDEDVRRGEVIEQGGGG